MDSNFLKAPFAIDVFLHRWAVKVCRLASVAKSYLPCGTWFNIILR